MAADAGAAMRIPALSLALALAAIVLAGSVTAKTGRCPGSKPGWWVQCGPAHAVVTVRGVTHTITHGACNGPRGGRLDFGIYSPRGVRHVGLGLRLERVRAGTVEVTDGELEVVPGIRVALSGTARVDRGFGSGTFSVHGRRADGRRIGGTIDGSWACG
jgi:hypothetical protein